MFMAPRVADATLPDVLADTMVVRKGEILYVSHVTWPSCTCKNTFPLDERVRMDRDGIEDPS